MYSPPPFRAEHLIRSYYVFTVFTVLHLHVTYIFWVAYVNVVSLLVSLAIPCKLCFVFYHVLVEREGEFSAFIKRLAI